MIINTGQRTDIPAFYSEWFFRRIREKYVLVRNPYYEEQVTRYRLDPDVVDLISFCTKNPAPMLPRLAELNGFRQFWYVTITPYGKEIEPQVPDKADVIRSFKELSRLVSPDQVGFRYDPIFFTEKYTPEFHEEAFRKICGQLKGFTHRAVISFIDLYEKTKRNFPEARPVPESGRLAIGRSFAEIGKRYGMRIYACHEGQDLAPFGIDCGGCQTKEVLEQAIGEELLVPASVSHPRAECRCLLGADIGAYNSCGHGCLYCYANANQELVRQRMRMHDPASPFLIGGARPGDIMHEAKQIRWRSGQITFRLR